MIWITAILLFSLSYLLQSWLWKRPKKRLPPGPRGFPILGNLHMLGSSPHRALHRLAQKHGPIMYLRLGFVPTIVVSSPHAAELFLKTHDLVFASRPLVEAIKQLCWGKCLSFSQYGSSWRNMRKFCTLELLSNLKINSFRYMRKEELDLLIRFIKEAAREGDAIDLTAKVSSLSADMSCRMIFGKKYMDKDMDERGFRAVIQEGMQLTATPYIGDYIPLIGAFDLQGLTRRMKAVRKIYDNFFDKIIDEHVNVDMTQDKKTTKDFVDILLGFVGSDEDPQHRIDRSYIKAILLDMLAASMDTSATAVDWTMAELIKHRRVMKKLQKELETVVGMDRVVEESDLEKLKYLDMVMKESLRLHAVAPLLLPHQSMEDCVVGEYFIPRNCRVIVNAWAIMRDPNAWSEAEKFWPERFEGSSVDVRGRDFQMIPFGSGRRICPGMQLGLTVVRLVVAQLVHCFDWKLPDDMSPAELDMTEEFSLTAPRVKHLHVIPTYRLHK